MGDSVYFVVLVASSAMVSCGWFVDDDDGEHAILFCEKHMFHDLWPLVHVEEGINHNLIILVLRFQLETEQE